MPIVERKPDIKTMMKLGKVLKGTSFEKMKKEPKKKDRESIFDKKPKKK